ncbi:hypothetical protein HK105_208160 [Polyrhizophydium stewartii]|uniref:Uncharacterized protein n=1 Tax=Polyrhizophydium stewartii TaxID=2732419 RepID=A0ABR4MYN9_9FUNG
MADAAAAGALGAGAPLGSLGADHARAAARSLAAGAPASAKRKRPPTDAAKDGGADGAVGASAGAGAGAAAGPGGLGGDGGDEAEHRYTLTEMQRRCKTLGTRIYRAKKRQDIIHKQYLEIKEQLRASKLVRDAILDALMRVAAGHILEKPLRKKHKHGSAADLTDVKHDQPMNGQMPYQGIAHTGIVTKLEDGAYAANGDDDDVSAIASQSLTPPRFG